MNSTETRKGTLAVIGADNAGDLESLLDNGFERIVLVEADPDLARKAEAMVGGLLSREVCIAVKNAVVAPEEGSATLQRFNLARFSSTQEPKGLRKLYPGLRVTSRVEVPATNLKSLLEGFVPDPRQQNALLVDLPGLAHLVVNQLIESGMLGAFQRIELRTGEQSLFEGCPPGPDIVDLLKRHGFRLEERVETDGPDRPTWVMSMDALRLENQSLRQELAQLRDDLANARTDHDLAQYHLQSERDSLSAKLSTTEEELSEATKRIESFQQEVNGLRPENQSLREELAQVRDELANARTDHDLAQYHLQSERDSLSAKLSTTEEELSEATKRIESFQQEVNGLRPENQSLREELAQVRDELGNARTEHDRAENHLQSERDSLSAKLLTTEEELSEATRRIESFQQEINELRNRLSESDSNADELRDRLNHCNVEIARAAGQLDVLRQLIPTNSQT